MENMMGFRNLLRKQWLLLGLILFLSFVFFLQLITGYVFDGFFMTFPREIVSAWDALLAGNMTGGDWWSVGTLLSAGLLHGNAVHLLGNLVFLWIFAALAAELLGQRWMLVIFIFTAITGNLCYALLNVDSYSPCLGASGAVMGFEGLYLAMACRWRLPDPHVWPMSRPIPPIHLALIGVLSLIFDFAGYMNGETGVAYGAHLGGFVGGMFLGGFIVRMPRVASAR